MAEFLEMRNIVKRFPGVLALDHVSLSVRKGEVRWLNMTAIENVFVAGDALTGPSKIGKAIYSGLRAARSLAQWLDLKAQNRQTEFAGDELISREADRFPGGEFRDAPRVRGR